jgi:cytochrome c-type biogenesis protein CcmH/NrfG
LNSEPAGGSNVSLTSRKLLRRFLVGIVLLVVLAVGASVVLWLRRPVLEPLPSVSAEKMDREIRRIIADASTHVALNVRDASAWGDLGAVFFVHGFETRSQVCFRNAERLDPTNYRWSYLLAVSLVYTDADQMIDAYRRAAQRCGQRAHVRLRLAETLLDWGELGEAATQIERVLADSPTNSRAQFAKARLLFAQGNIAEARTWAEKSADGSGKRAPNMLLAQLCRRLHDSEGEAKAVAALRQLPDGFTPWDDPDMATILALRQDRASRQAQPENLTDRENANSPFAMTEGSGGSSEPASLAKALIQENNFPEAESLLRRQLSGSPNDERLRFLLAQAYLQQEKYSEAEVEYGLGLRLKPDDVDAWHRLGIVRLKLGKQDEAGHAFTATIRISPSNVSARLHLAELLLNKGKTEEALEHLTIVLKLAPDDKKTTELLARARAGRK